jgi:hypothetical protein
VRFSRISSRTSFGRDNHGGLLASHFSSSFSDISYRISYIDFPPGNLLSPTLVEHLISLIRCSTRLVVLRYGHNDLG